jgi:lysophospholipase L1-like esterase
LGLLSKKGTIRFEIPEKNQYIYPHGSHPNAQGHRLIAQTLYDFIKSKNIDTKI